MIYKKGLLASERLSPVSGNKWLDGLSILSYIKRGACFGRIRQPIDLTRVFSYATNANAIPLALATLFINYLLRPLDAVLQPNGKVVSAVGRVSALR